MQRDVMYVRCVGVLSQFVCECECECESVSAGERVVTTLSITYIP